MDTSEISPHVEKFSISPQLLYMESWNFSKTIFSTNNISDISDKYQVCIYIYLSYVPCKYMFQFLAESMRWCWMVACPAMAGGDWTNPSTVFPKTCQTSSQNIRIYVALNIFPKHQNIRSAKHLLRIYLEPMFFSNIRAYLATNIFSNVKSEKTIFSYWY